MFIWIDLLVLNLVAVVNLVVVNLEVVGLAPATAKGVPMILKASKKLYFLPNFNSSKVLPTVLNFDSAKRYYLAAVAVGGPKMLLFGNF
jgi:hypothetical protein